MLKGVFIGKMGVLGIFRIGKGQSKSLTGKRFGGILGNDE
jgi:hypothetical protein